MYSFFSRTGKLFPELVLYTKNARIAVEILIFDHSEVIFFMYIFELIDQVRKNNIFPWVTFKCLSVQLCDPQDLMKNRKKPSEKDRCRFRYKKNYAGNKV